MKFRKIVITLWTILLATIIATSASALQVNDTETATIGVTISEVVQVNLDPSAYTWSALNPGDEGNGSTEASGFGALQVENIGSHNITHLWFNVTQPSSRPFGTGEATNWNAGNFIVLQNQSGGDFYFIDRVEWNDSRGLVYVKDPEGSLPYDIAEYTVGRIKNATNEYMFMINYTDDCNETGAMLWIGHSPHTAGSSGYIDFQDDNRENVSLTRGGTNNEWGVGEIDDGPLSGYCVAVYRTCGYLRLYKTNMEAPGADAICTNNAYYTIGETGDSNPRYNTAPLTPGASIIMNVRVRIPYGVYEGTVSPGTLTVLVNDA